jgi:hypothetical protein
MEGCELFKWHTVKHRAGMGGAAGACSPHMTLPPLHFASILQLDQLVQMLDVDGDGVVTADELMSLAQVRGMGHAEWVEWSEVLQQHHFTCERPIP